MGTPADAQAEVLRLDSAGNERRTDYLLTNESRANKHSPRLELRPWLGVSRASANRLFTGRQPRSCVPVADTDSTFARAYAFSAHKVQPSACSAERGRSGKIRSRNRRIRSVIDGGPYGKLCFITNIR